MSSLKYLKVPIKIITFQPIFISVFDQDTLTIEIIPIINAFLLNRYNRHLAKSITKESSYLILISPAVLLVDFIFIS